MFGGAVQERIACGIGRSVWRSREPSSIGEGMETLSLVAKDVVASPPPPRGGLISKSKLTERFDKLARGEWVKLIHAECSV